jgi:hypothetical protein
MTQIPRINAARPMAGNQIEGTTGGTEDTERLPADEVIRTAKDAKGAKH